MAVSVSLVDQINRLTSTGGFTVQLGTAAADRQVCIIATHEYNTSDSTNLNTVTLGGLSLYRVATSAPSEGEAVLEMVYGQNWIPTGTSATLSCSNEVGKCRFDVYRIVGAILNPTAYGQTDGTDPLSYSATIPTNGAAICGYGNSGNSSSIAWTNATVQTNSIVETISFSSAIRTTSGTATITANGDNVTSHLKVWVYSPETGFSLSKFSGVNSTTLTKMSGKTLTVGSKISGVTL